MKNWIYVQQITSTKKKSFVLAQLVLIYKKEDGTVPFYWSTDIQQQQQQQQQHI